MFVCLLAYLLIVFVCLLACLLVCLLACLLVDRQRWMIFFGFVDLVEAIVGT